MDQGTVVATVLSYIDRHVEHFAVYYVAGWAHVTIESLDVLEGVRQIAGLERIRNVTVGEKGLCARLDKRSFFAVVVELEPATLYRSVDNCHMRNDWVVSVWFEAAPGLAVMTSCDIYAITAGQWRREIARIPEVIVVE